VDISDLFGLGYMIVDAGYIPTTSVSVWIFTETQF